MPDSPVFTIAIAPRWRSLYGERVFQNGFAEVGLGWSLQLAYFDYDEGFSEASSVNYADTEVLGRVESYKSFVGVSNREIPLTFQFHATGEDTLAGGQVPESQTDAGIILREVQNPVRFLDALKYPVVISGVSYAPPPVLLTIGGRLVMRAIATSVEIQWKGPWDPVSKVPMAAEVSTVFTSVTDGTERGAAIWRYQGNVDNRST